MKFCMNCGAKLNEDSSFCTQCGQRIQKIEPASAINNDQTTANSVDAEKVNTENAAQTNITAGAADQSANTAAANNGNQAGTNNGNVNGAAGVYYTKEGYRIDQYTVINRPVIERGLTAIIGYLGWLGFLIAMVGGDRKEKYARYHLSQALLIHLTITIGAIIYMIGTGLITGFAVNAYYGYYGVGVGFVVGMVLLIVGVAVVIYTFVCWIIGIVRVCKGSVKPLPIFGNFRILK